MNEISRKRKSWMKKYLYTQVLCNKLVVYIPLFEIVNIPVCIRRIYFPITEV